MDFQSIIDSTDEYKKQLTLEKLLEENAVLTEEQINILKNCTSSYERTQYYIGLLLKETTLLNLARLFPFALNPHAIEDEKNMALAIIGDIDIEDTLDKIARITETNEVETVVYQNMWGCDFIE